MTSGRTTGVTTNSAPASKPRDAEAPLAGQLCDDDADESIAGADDAALIIDREHGAPLALLDLCRRRNDTHRNVASRGGRFRRLARTERERCNRDSGGEERRMCSPCNRSMLRRSFHEFTVRHAIPRQPSCVAPISDAAT